MKIFDLFNIPKDMLPLTGGKAARLCELHQAGFNVPSGFVIYDAETAEDIAAAAEHWESSGLGSVAVRSSAFGEDGGAASSAGQYETVLNVNSKDAFIAAVKTCLDSLESVTATAYNKNFGEHEIKRMTVVVQKMITPYAAGVCFSKDPAGGKGVLVEAVRGPGEALVSGKEAADEYRVSGDAITRKGDILSDKQILQIANGSLEAAGKFGFTADTEWAISEDGEIFWLQIRPVTTEELPDMHEFDGRQDLEGHVVTTCNISEMMPGAVTPLTLSTSVRSLDWAVRKLMVNSHAYPDMDTIPPYSIYFSIGNHLFGDITPMYMMLGTMIMTNKSSIEMALCGVEIKESSPPDIPKKSLLVCIRNFIRYIGAVLGKGKACKTADRIAQELSFNTSADALKLWAEIDNKMYILNEVMYHHHITSAFSAMMSSALNRQLAGFFDDNEEQRAAVAGCLENIPDIESADILNSMYSLAEAVKEESGKKDFTPESIRKLVENGGETVRQAYDAFMQKHGHRSISECEMRNLSLCDDPETFYNQLSLVANSNNSAESADPNGWLKNQDALLARIPQKKHSTYKKIIKFSREGVRVREYTKSRLVKVTWKFKKAYGSLAEKLVAAGLLPDADAVYFLTHEELGKLVSGQGDDLVKKAIARRRLYPEQQKLRFPAITFGRPEAITQHKSGEGESKWNGTAVSRGTYEGSARVVMDISDANKLQPGEIMIASFTDAGWTPYYSTIGALVTEVGAALSHGAVVAREYSLPLVTNISDITYMIHTGDIVRVDGNTGTVTLLKKASR